MMLGLGGFQAVFRGLRAFSLGCRGKRGLGVVHPGSSSLVQNFNILRKLKTAVFSCDSKGASALQLCSVL